METSTASNLSPTAFNNTWKMIVQFILDSAPEGLRASDRKHLEYCLTVDAPGTYLNLCFERNTPEYRASADIIINFDSLYGSNNFKDVEGNLWKELEFTVSINAPAYGSASPATYMKRIELLSDVTKFAQVVFDTFNEPMYMMMSTAAEVAKQEATNKARELEALCRRLVLNNRTKMRVHQEREVVIEDVEVMNSIPVGHDVTVEANDGKTYQLRKSGIHAVYITRLS